MSQPQRPPRPRFWTTYSLFLSVLFLVYAGLALRSSALLRREQQLIARDMSALKGGPQAARGTFDADISRARTDPSVWIHIIQACRQAKQPGLGVEYGERAVAALKGETPQIRAAIYSELMAAYQDADPTRPNLKATAAAHEMLKLTPDDPEALNAAGYVLADNNVELDQARVDITRALRILHEQSSDDNPTTLMALTEDSYGWLLYREKQYLRSLAVLEQAVADLPSGSTTDGSADLYYHIGMAARAAGRITRSRQAFLVALTYDPAHAQARAELATLPPDPPSPPPSDPSLSGGPAPASTPAPLH